MAPNSSANSYYSGSKKSAADSKAQSKARVHDYMNNGSRASIVKTDKKIHDSAAKLAAVKKAEQKLKNFDKYFPSDR